MKILVAADGSRHSWGAIAFLANFPFASPPEVVVSVVCHAPELEGSGKLVNENVQELIREHCAEAERILNEAVAKCTPWASGVKSHLLDGNPSKELLTLADQERVDLIVMGSRGLGSVDRFFLGSVSEKVTLHAKCSVLVVRTSGEEEFVECQSILFADDGSEQITQAIDRFSTCPLGPDRQAVILGVLESSSNKKLREIIENNPYWKSQKARLQEHLETSVKKFEPTGARIQLVLEKSENTADQILKSAETYGADLIVLGSYSKNAWERFLLGSVSTRVLRHATCSVWIERTKPTK